MRSLVIFDLLGREITRQDGTSFPAQPSPNPKVDLHPIAWNSWALRFATRGPGDERNRDAAARFVFGKLFDEINSTKRQQWITTNYCVLILAVIYAVELPGYLAVATAIVGSALVLWMQWHIARSRMRLDKLHKIYFREDELRDTGLSDAEIKGLDTQTQLQQSLRGWEFLIVLIGVLVVGAIVVWLHVHGHY
jgi:hypothetical protein